MYLPVMINLGDVLMRMKAYLPHSDTVDMTAVIQSMFEKIFYDKQTYHGQYRGPFGAYRQQVPDTAGMTDFDIDLVLHQTELDVLDLLGGFFPTITTDLAKFFYHYPNGENQTNLIIYVPMNQDECPSDFRTKLLPAHAVRYTRR